MLALLPQLLMIHEALKSIKLLFHYATWIDFHRKSHLSSAK